jgi:hypothetical protein
MNRNQISRRQLLVGLGMALSATALEMSLPRPLRAAHLGQEGAATPPMSKHP